MAKVNTMAGRMRGAKEAEASPAISRPSMPDKVTVTKAANGGFIVKKYGGHVSEYDAKDEVYKNLAGVKKCMAEHFGGGEEDEEKPEAKAKE